MSPNFPALVQLLTDRLPQVMSRPRVQHVSGVTHTAVILASCHGLDPAKAALAGLLHDQFKEVHPNRLRDELKARGEDIASIDLDFPKVWHGARAASFARRELNLGDADLLEAVTLHTTSDAGVGPLTRVLFIADYTEPGRHYEHAAEIYETARRDLNEGYRQALQAKTGHVLMHGRQWLHPRGLRALQEVLGPDEFGWLASAESEQEGARQA